jgi:hypothetical protein
MGERDINDRYVAVESSARNRKYNHRFMSRLLWLSAPECLESIVKLSGLKGATSERLHELLFEAVCRGEIRAMLNEVVVPKEHIKVLLTLYVYCANQSSNKLPTDLALSFDDICAVFDIKVVDDEKPQLPVRPEDRTPSGNAHRRPPEDPSVPPISAAEAASIILSASSASTGGAFQDLSGRLVRALLRYFDPRAKLQRQQRTGQYVNSKGLHLNIS